MTKIEIETDGPWIIQMKEDGDILDKKDADILFEWILTSVNTTQYPEDDDENENTNDTGDKMNNEDKIDYIEEQRAILVGELLEKGCAIEDTSNLYKRSERPHKYGGWKDRDGDIANITFDGLDYKYANSNMERLFTIKQLQEMINMADKILARIDDNINEEYQKALNL